MKPASENLRPLMSLCVQGPDSVIHRLADGNSASCCGELNGLSLSAADPRLVVRVGHGPEQPYEFGDAPAKFLHVVDESPIDTSDPAVLCPSFECLSGDFAQRHIDRATVPSTDGSQHPFGCGLVYELLYEFQDDEESFRRFAVRMIRGEGSP